MPHTSDTHSWSIDVAFDARYFLEVPQGLRQRPETQGQWVDRIVGELNVHEAWSGSDSALRVRLAGQVALLSADAFAAFLFCPRGLPADALVEVFVTESETSEWNEVGYAQESAVPQRVVSVTSPHLGEGRLVTTLVMNDGVPVGELRVQYLYDGLLVEVVAVSSDLDMLGVAVVAIEELAAGVVVQRAKGASV